MWELAENNGLKLDLVLTLSEHPTLTENLYAKLKTLAKHIASDAKQFVVYTDEGNFDLVGEKMIYFSEKVAIKNELEDYRREVYATITEKLNSEAKNLLEIRRIVSERSPTLDRFRNDP